MRVLYTNNRLMKYAALLCFLVLSFVTQAQKRYFAQNLIVGTSFTYIWDYSNFDRSVRYYDLTYHINTAVRLSKRLYWGFDGLFIRAGGTVVPYENYKMLGSVFQYDVLGNGEGGRWLIEVGYFRGDYCTCNKGNPEWPFRRAGINYLDVGFGGEIRLIKDLFLDIGFNRYYLLDKIPEKYSWTQYVLGLNYKF